MIILKSERELQYMREVGRLVAQAHKLVAKAVRPGVTTGQLDTLVADFFTEVGARAAFKGYHGYPAHICTSVNEELVHGIPGERVLQDGDICSVDIGAELNGYYGDAAVTLAIGNIDANTKRLLTVTEEALHQGIKAAVAGAYLSDISHAIQTHVESAGMSVVRDYVGHGIGRSMHEDPQVLNYGPPGRGVKLRPGLTLALEPMVNVGSHLVQTLDDGWTVVTTDGRLCAHFEHSIAIHADRTEILTVE